MLFKDCKNNALLLVGSRLYYKVPMFYYIGSQSKPGIYNAVKAETGEIGWIDYNKKVSVLNNEQKLT